MVPVPFSCDTTNKWEPQLNSCSHNTKLRSTATPWLLLLKKFQKIAAEAGYSILESEDRRTHVGCLWPINRTGNPLFTSIARARVFRVACPCIVVCLLCLSMRRRWHANAWKLLWLELPMMTNHSGRIYVSWPSHVNTNVRYCTASRDGVPLPHALRMLSSSELRHSFNFLH